MHAPARATLQIANDGSVPADTWARIDGWIETGSAWFSFLGLLLGVVTLVVAIVQLRKTRRAADAARVAAQGAVAKMQFVQNLVNLEQLCSRSIALQSAVKGPNRALTIDRAAELRNALARFHGVQDGADPFSAGVLECLGRARDIHSEIYKTPPKTPIGPDVLDSINALHEKLLQMSGGESARMGV